MRTLGAMVAVAVVVAVLAVPSVASAQVGCVRGAVTQHDIAGMYQSDTMNLTIYGCGGSHMVWSNAYGLHEATYLTTQRMPDGVVAVGGASSDGLLDGSLAIGYKAAKPQYLQVITSGPLGARVYKLRKVY